LSGGEIVARTLRRHGVEFLFTLCGGHISPILVESRRAGLRIVDVRHEATAVFAADAAARLSGVPGVAVVTAGPGVTNTVTAIKNAQLAQSPLLVLGGATATVLEGRGSLQDIDQLSLLRSCVKWMASARRVRDLAPALEEALRVCRSGVPGPVFLECPLDVLYDERVVRDWYGRKSAGGGLKERLIGLYLERHLDRLFAAGGSVPPGRPVQHEGPGARASRRASPRLLRRAASWLTASRRPVLLIGSQATVDARGTGRLAEAVARLGVPTYLSGMARGLLGARHPLQRRHHRREALREADLVLLAGVPADFRLDYGRQLGRGARIVSVNLSERDLRLNRRPDLGVIADAGRFLVELADLAGPSAASWEAWCGATAERDALREAEIARRAARPTDRGVNPLQLFGTLDEMLPENSVLVADGGDFVATAAYTLAPRAPLSWLDPGVFGTLGVGGGFALGARLCRPGAEVWILYGDGSAAYSLAELDTFVRHRLPVIALVGNDASWAQIAREQVPMLGDDVGTVLRHSEYERVAEGYGARGLAISDPEQVRDTLETARRLHGEGHAVVVNVRLAASDFRRGSLSM
jgi:acetolactate synthase-1/2/3 large subunit